MISLLHGSALRRSSLWALVTPPTVWALHFLFSYVYAAIHCAKAGRLEGIGDVPVAIGAATMIALLIVVACGYVAWAQSRVEGDPPPHQESTEEDRLRFLAVATLLLAGLSFVAIVFTALPAMVFGDCR
jgi:hypothetical protein